MCDEVLSHALLWLEMGVVPIPILARSKAPAIRWAPFQRVLPSKAVVERWFSVERNLGLVCGPVSGNFVVLDFDMPLAYHKWHRERRIDTYTVATARGYHCYFRILGPTWTAKMNGGDIKANGYVLAPPSIHPSGVPYRVHHIPEHQLIFEAESLSQIGIRPLSPQYRASSDLATPALPVNPGESLIDAIKASIPILTLLYQIGANPEPSGSDGFWWMCCCPFHDDHNPSMWVNPRSGICRCFNPQCPGHERAMDVINVHALLNGLSNEGAILSLAARLGL